MNPFWSWVIGLATIGGTVISIVLGIRTFASADFPTFLFGLVVGATLGAMACAFVWFKKPRAQSPNPVSRVADVVRPSSEISSLELDESVAANQANIKQAKTDADVERGLAAPAWTFQSSGGGSIPAKRRRPALWIAVILGALGFVAFVVGLSVFTINKPLSYGVGPSGLVIFAVAVLVLCVSAVAERVRSWQGRRSSRAGLATCVPGSDRADTGST